jgi:RND superfamily putative drug exporter
VTALALGALALGLFALNANGLSTEDSFINKPDSVVGQEVAGKHFPAGHGQPVIVVGNAGAATQLSDAVRNTDGITEVAEPVTKNGLVSIEGTVIAQPDSDAAKATVNRVRDAVHAVPGADAKVGGQTAMIIDMDRATNHDNQVIIPLVLLVVLLILGLLLRAIVAPLVLIATVVLSFGAALGVSALLFQAFGFNGADSSFPLFVFVFLVALGIDYNIFLVSRIREEAKRQGTKRGVITGLSATGGVITSAGLVLAATFGVLASLPMVFFAELGIAVAVGILLDTFIVRSILVTALNLDLDRRMWWPSKLSAKQSAVSGPDRDEDKDKEPALAN